MASNSTNLIGDITTVIANGPAVATTTKANAAAGPIMDYPGNCNLVKTKYQEIVALLGNTAGLKGIIDDTDAGTDSTNRNLLIGISHLCTGGSAPSTTAIADIGTVIANGPSATTKGLAIAPGGPIMDYVGNCNLISTKLKECSVLLGGGSGLKGIIDDTDAGTDSTNRNLLLGQSQVLV